jgi:hypothetical protein
VETTPHPIMEMTWENYYQTAEILVQKIEESDWEFEPTYQPFFE